jgi:hypothetical protein
VVNLGLLHAPLTIGLVEEREHPIERLLGVVQHVGKGSPEAILKKKLSRKDYPSHGVRRMNIPKLHLQLL